MQTHALTEKEELARELGSDHGANKASWNEDPFGTLTALRNEDPEVLASIAGPLSGQYAGDYSMKDLEDELDLTEVEDSGHYADLYEEAFHEAWEEALRERLTKDEKAELDREDA